MTTQTSHSIAIIGGGVAGLTSAYLLSKKHDVTVFEANAYLGGHTNTITLDNPTSKKKSLRVDTGFIVFNDKNYTNFLKLIDALNVPKQESTMSFSYYSKLDDFMYGSDFPKGVFAQPKNIFNSKFLKMLLEIKKFYSAAKKDLTKNKIPNIDIISYAKSKGLSDSFIYQHLVPMGAAIWSTAEEDAVKFPANSFLQFWENHGLLSLNKRPQWYTIKNGSKSYVEAIIDQSKFKYHTNTPIKQIERTEKGPKLTLPNNTKKRVDYVIVATHADQALRLLKDPTVTEKQLLSHWRYSNNHTILHNDTSPMSYNKNIWSSWNYIKQEEDAEKDPVNVTYYMNRLQNLETNTDYFVSLNNKTQLKKDNIIREIDYTHPIFDYNSVQTQPKLNALNNINRTFFCGSYFGYGFHEDAVTSALDVTHYFGLSL